MKIHANAKINIGLCVGKKRDDGYHPIKSYFARLSLADELEIEVESADSFSCNIISSCAYLDRGKIDIMEKCAKSFSDKTGIYFNLSINIEKKIPFKAGFGGGSSDGAAVLSFLNEYFDYPLSKEELMELGAICGSDIPFFLYDVPFAYVEGRGDIIEPQDIPDGLDNILLFMPEEEVSTASAYSALDQLSYPFKVLPLKIEMPIEKDSFPNDFEKVASNPLLKELMDIYKDKAYVSLSGSGSGCFVVADKENLHYLLSIAPRNYILARII